MRVHDIHPEENLEDVLSEFEAQTRGEKTLSVSIPCLRKDGTVRYANINSANVIIDGRKCNAGFFTDITEYKRLKSDLEEYREKVYDAQKHAYVGSMGAIVAHQLNQPLTMINMLLGRSIEQLKDESCCPSVLKDMEESLDESKKAASIIAKFREYARDPAFEVRGIVNVNSTANKVISSLAEKAEHTRMNISVKGLDGLPEVEISEIGLEQIFFIIIQNALEAADCKERHKLIITGKSADEKVQLQFSDDCCGIAPENLDKIFEPFFSTKINGKRLGLGLEVIQQILISFGGEIRVESQFGRGTTFYVTLPISNTSKS